MVGAGPRRHDGLWEFTGFVFLLMSPVPRHL
jgi:hypothetical protein